VVLEREIDGIDPRVVDGKILADHRHTLEAVAHEMDLPGLGEFVAFSEAEAEALADDMKFDNPTTGGGRWFQCAKGLEVVRAIHEYLGENPDEIDSPDDVTSIRKGLEAMRAILEAGASADTRFRLSIDY
jgi:hypothetical protein